MASGPSSVVFLLYGSGKRLALSSGVMVGLRIREGGKYAGPSHIFACQSLIFNRMYVCFGSVAPVDRFTDIESSFESSNVKSSMLKSIHEEKPSMELI